jgi:CheY-like chemotaxis protein
VDDALEFIEGAAGEVRLLVLDIMMPPGRSFDSAQTRYGLDTGIRFYERVRRHSPALPVIILTNVTDEEAARHFRAQPSCWFLRKRDYLPYELEQTIRDILSKQGGNK